MQIMSEICMVIFALHCLALLAISPKVECSPPHVKAIYFCPAPILAKLICPHMQSTLIKSLTSSAFLFYLLLPLCCPWLSFSESFCPSVINSLCSSNNDSRDFSVLSVFVLYVHLCLSSLVMAISHTASIVYTSIWL